ncbi:hypothetical protein BB560_003203 [Smittium megazygosporum]|uniref:Uncharacterized protein n=1 Tax=Smittium megazygosporum TaxID=133381 RepID=A0A2T9ZCL7_9FUNG|nr:hypothetical protein BB560_003203 [Smittium megazygosporum]
MSQQNDLEKKIYNKILLAKAELSKAELICFKLEDKRHLLPFTPENEHLFHKYDAQIKGEKEKIAYIKDHLESLELAYNYYLESSKVEKSFNTPFTTKSKNFIGGSLTPALLGRHNSHKTSDGRTDVPSSLPQFRIGSKSYADPEHFLIAFRRIHVAYGFDPNIHWSRLFPLCTSNIIIRWVELL